MKTKLRIASCNFFSECIVKLEEKEKKGWYGWDDSENKKLLQERLMEHTKKPLTEDNLVDISNFCNFLWNLEEYEHRKREREILLELKKKL